MRAVRASLQVIAVVAAMATGVAWAASNMSSDEKLKTANASVEKMKSTLAAALVKHEAAKAENDILKVTCISDQLSAIKGLLKISEDSIDALKEAIGRNDAELIDHQYTKVSIAASRVEGFGVEVEACMGEASKYTGETIREAVVDPDIRSDDPSEVGPNEDYIDPKGILASGPEGAVRPPNVSGSE